MRHTALMLAVVASNSYEITWKAIQPVRGGLLLQKSRVKLSARAVILAVLMFRLQATLN